MKSSAETVKKKPTYSKPVTKEAKTDKYTWYEGIASVSYDEQLLLREVDEETKQILKIIIDSVFCWRASPRPQDMAVKGYFSDCLAPLDHPDGHYTHLHSLDLNPSLNDIVSFFSDRVPNKEAQEVLAKLKRQYINPKIKSSMTMFALEALLSILKNVELPKIEQKFWGYRLFDKPSWLDIISKSFKKSHQELHFNRLGLEIEIKGAFIIPDISKKPVSEGRYELECTQYCSIPQFDGITIMLDKFRQKHDTTQPFSEEEAKLRSNEIRIIKSAPTSSLLPPIEKELIAPAKEEQSTPSAVASALKSKELKDVHATKIDPLNTITYLCNAILHGGLSGVHKADANKILNKIKRYRLTAELGEKALINYLSRKEQHKPLKSTNYFYRTIKILSLIFASNIPDTPLETDTNVDDILNKIKAKTKDHFLPISEDQFRMYLNEAPEIESF